MPRIEFVNLSLPANFETLFLEVFSWNVTFVGNPGIFGSPFGIAGMKGDFGHILLIV